MAKVALFPGLWRDKIEIMAEVLKEPRSQAYLPRLLSPAV